MYCNKCGNEIRQDQKYCNKCGNLINRKKKNLMPLVTAGVVTSLVLIGLGIFIVLNNNKNNYYFNEDIAEVLQPNVTQTEASTTTKTGKYKTAIITDNVYSGVSIKSIADANKLISTDSQQQKKADYPKEIIKIENDIIKKYSITAVNLKEMDVEFAKELENVIKNIYNEYPKARGYLTNLTLTNLDMSENGVIALFMPIFMFGTSNTSTTRPWVIKTQVQLNAKYFLNPERITSAVESSSKSGHFPKNATKYSPVAHEFGHYLSFIALLNYHSTKSIVVIGDNQMQAYYDIYKEFADGTFSKLMLDEAYKNYVKDNGNIDFDEWRGKISAYALAKDNSGEYIYDETIAEAFHDVYLNGANANIASKYIVSVLRKYIEG